MAKPAQDSLIVRVHQAVNLALVEAGAKVIPSSAPGTFRLGTINGKPVGDWLRVSETRAGRPFLFIQSPDRQSWQFPERKDGFDFVSLAERLIRCAADHDKIVARVASDAALGEAAKAQHERLSNKYPFASPGSGRVEMECRGRGIHLSVRLEGLSDAQIEPLLKALRSVDKIPWHHNED